MDGRDPSPQPSAARSSISNTTIGPASSVDLSQNESLDDFVSSLGVMDSEGQKTVFEIIPSKPDGNCMFRALSQSMYGHERHHEKCRQEVVAYISDDLNWPHFSTHIKGQNDHLVKKAKVKDKERGRGDKSNETPTGGVAPSSSSAGEEEDAIGLKETYRKYMLGDGVYGTLQELIAASDVFEFNLIVVRQLNPSFFNILSFKDSFTHDVTHHFLFTGTNPDDGHFEFLEPASQFIEIEPNPIKIEKGYYRIISIEDHCVVMQQHFGPVPSSDDTEEEEQNSDREAASHPAVDINANAINPDDVDQPSGRRRPARIELKRVGGQAKGSRVNSDSDDNGHWLGGRPSRLSQLFRNKVHPSSSGHALLPQNQAGGSKGVKEGQIPNKWKFRLQSICCCSGGYSPP